MNAIAKICGAWGYRRQKKRIVVVVDGCINIFMLVASAASESDEAPVKAMGCAPGLLSALESAKRFLREYVREWQPTDRRAATRVAEALKRLKALIDQYDAVLLVKPGGMCPFCNMEFALLQKMQNAQEGGFTLHAADLLVDERDALKIKYAEELGDVLKYPVLFVRGARISGSFPELKLMRDSGALETALTSARVHFAAPTAKELVNQLPGRSESPKLLQQAGGGDWLTFQTKLYGNVLRVIALLQVCLLAVALAIYSNASSESGSGETGSSNGERVASVLLLLIGVDALLFVLTGPTPLQPLGVVATCLVWSRRGAIASAVPYKVTFGLYVAACLLNMGCTYGSVCPLTNGEALTTTLLVNSSLLAVFRF